MLEKNLAALAKNQPKLVETIRETVITDKTVLFMGPNDDINIAYEDCALHRMADPLVEATETFEANVPEDARGHQSVIFIYGLGLGYLARRAMVSSEATVIVFEPYLEVLRQTLSVVDLTQDIESNRLYFVTQLSDLFGVVGRFYLAGDNVKMMALPQYHAKDPQGYLDFLTEMRHAMGTNLVGQNTAILMTEAFTNSALKNLGRILQYPDAQIVHGSCKDMPAVIVSAGPSLDNPGVMEALKANRDNLIISCVGQAAKALDRAGIVPDLVSLLEIKEITQQLDGVSYLDEVNMVMLPQTNQAMFDFQTKRKLIAYSNKDPLTYWLAMTLEQRLFGYAHQGTVSITALIYAMLLGCNPIFLVGQDLAYAKGKLYADNSVYEKFRMVTDAEGNQKLEMDNLKSFYGKDGFFNDDSEWERRQKSILAQMIDIEGWDGEPLKTSTGYDAFRKAFEHIAHMHPDYTLVNCSEGGAKIAGIEHLPFVEALQKYEGSKFQPRPVLEAALQHSYQEFEPGSEPYQKVYARYLQDKDDLVYLKDTAQRALDETAKALDEISTKKTVSHSLQSRLKKLDMLDETLKDLCRLNPMINAYIKRDMLGYYRDYDRKLQRNVDESQLIGDVVALQENLENGQILYNAMLKGAQSLSEVLESVFKDFPVNQSVSTASPV